MTIDFLRLKRHDKKLNTKSENSVASHIAAHGPLSVAEYMNLALHHPKYGYYRSGDPIGLKGDFTTAPEISQLFGDLIGIWCVDTWEALGKPNKLSLVELGPGRGTLMADLLRATRVRPDFGKAATIYLVEMNPHLQDKQKKTLGQSAAVSWHLELPVLPDSPVIIIANEFFDCLPVRQFIMTEQGWRERGVDLDAQGNLGYVVLNRAVNEIALQAFLRNFDIIGRIAEISPDRDSYMHKLTAMLAKRTGRGLFIDYGHVRSDLGDTLQAMRHHRHVDALSSQGECDLTAHVDFEALGAAAIMDEISVYGPVSQGRFLTQMGIELRARKLSDAASAQQVEKIYNELERLISTDQMGAIFKVLAVSSAGLPSPAGF